MNDYKCNSERGSSLLEVLTVIVIGTILVAIAISQFGTSREQLKRQNIARELKNNLERCRFDSVKRRATDLDYANMSRVVLRNETKYDVMIDSNLNGTIESTEVRTVDFGASDTKVLAPSSLFPVTIRFDRKGHITTDGNGTPISPLFTICSGICTMATTITPENGNVISISPTGTVAMLYGGDVIPPLDAPTVSNIPNDSGINLWLTITANNTPTPAPSVTVTPTPLTTPTVEPTPITATPTPTPANQCTLNAKPSLSGCLCLAPRYVRTNGKCQ